MRLTRPLADLLSLPAGLRLAAFLVCMVGLGATLVGGRWTDAIGAQASGEGAARGALPAPVEVLGAPVATLTLALSKPADAQPTTAVVVLQNAGDAPALLEGFGLSTDAQRPFAWTFPKGAVLAPGARLQVQAGAAVSAAGSERSGRADEEPAPAPNGRIPELRLTAPTGTPEGLLLQRLRLPATVAPAGALDVLGVGEAAAAALP